MTNEVINEVIEELAFNYVVCKNCGTAFFVHPDESNTTTCPKCNSDHIAKLDAE